VYLLPAAAVVAALAVTAIVLPRWRAATRAQAPPPVAASPKLSPADARRLDEDLRAFDA
jgi:hypothetical protein